MKAKTASGYTVKIGNWYERVDSCVLRKLKRDGSAAYWYEIIPAGQKKHYVIRAHTIKNSIGASGSWLFFEDFTNHGDWLTDEFSDDFEGATFGLRDFCVGLLYARQVYAKNRHRLSIEMVPGYRQIRQSFATPSYTTSFAATDPDGLDYTRLVTVNNYKEELFMHRASFQLDFRYDWYFLKYLSLFVSAGIDNLFDLAKASDVTFGATYAGQYGEDLFNVVIDDNGYYDFGTYPDNHIVTDNESVFRYSLYGSASAGLQFCIGPALSLEAAVVYQKLMFDNEHERVEDAFCLSESSGQYQSMCYAMKPTALNRIGLNVKLKVNF